MFNLINLPLGDALFIAALCQLGVVIVFLFLNRKGEWRLNVMLALVLLFGAVPALSTFVLAQEALRQLFPFAHIGNATVFVVGPLLFLYARKYLTNRFTRSPRSDGLHLILFAIVLALFIVLAVWQGDNYTYQNLDIVSSLALFLYTGWYVHRRKKNSAEKRPVFWPVFLFAGYLALFLGRFVIFLTWEVLSLANLCPYTYNLYFMAFIFFVNILVLLALRGASVFQRRDRYRHSKLGGGEKDILEKRIRERMERDKPYLDPLLSLDGLALAVELSAKELSQIVNERFAMNFSDYINSYRVRETIRLLRERQPAGGGKRTILDASLEAGFNSKSTFNQAFKKHTGLSPRDYLKKREEKGNEQRWGR
jgi:AraC-like DNA-binding protein